MFDLVPTRRRLSLRRAYRASCQAVRLDGFRLVGRRILDVSHRGALLECDDDIALHDELVISFDAPRGGPVIDAVAEVRRVVDGPFGVRAGLCFTELTWDARAALFVRLGGTPPPIPSRRPVIDYAESVRRIALS